MATQKERFLKYLQTCVKSTRATDSNPLLLGGNAPKDYARFLEPERLFDYNPSKWAHLGSMYDITDYDKALAIFYELISDDGFIQRDKIDNQGWRRGSISHYVCFLSAEKFFKENDLSEDVNADKGIGDTPDCPSNLPLQQIFYGAPGTGKSFTVDDVCKKYTHFRTTFHPDSDYSTFVGCYKPTMKNTQKVYSEDELIKKLTEIKTTGTTYPCHKFATIYWESLINLSSAVTKSILTACGFTESMNMEILKGVAIGQYLVDKSDSKRLSYTFVPQTFTNAYIKAWKDLTKPVFLVIEEINRGNCAQIFGDLFQLLDRDENGFSKYPIKPDTDLGNYIAEALNECHSEKYSNIILGKELALPSNLYIWATMNTSDQSLFPIDSAFKRRWEWKYIPIHDVENIKYKIEVCDVGKTYRYDWWDFLDKVNTAIGNATSSEDKKLGYFFCKADKKAKETDDEPSIITANRFVGKVIFYIWNDVFKDYDTSDAQFRCVTKDGVELQLSLLSYTNEEYEVKRLFSSFFDFKGDALPTEVIRLLDDLKVEKEEVND